MHPLFQINTDTWFYAKRCFLSLIETMAKHMIILKDTSISEILDFLDAADQYGKQIQTVSTKIIGNEPTFSIRAPTRSVKISQPSRTR